MNGKITWSKPMLLVALLAAFSNAYSADTQQPKNEPAANPAAVERPNQSEEDGQQIEPEVTIIRKEEKTIEEYRVNGQFYMAKITPVVGKPYYLIDADGDGNLETKQFELAADFAIPSWVIFSW
jgi:hypothetical protein